MDITLITADKLKIELSREDMEALSIEYENLDYSNEQTRSALIALLDKSRAEAGFNPRGAKLFIEVYPTESGGCVLYFTAMRRESHGRSVPAPVVFEFDDVETLISCCTKGFRQYGHRIFKSALFRFEDTYRLVLHPLDYNDMLSVYFFREYARLVGEGEVLAAFTEEHGLPLLSENALDTLSEYFG